MIESINVALAAFPGVPVFRAMHLAVEAELQSRLHTGLQRLSVDNVQICPQNPGPLTLDDVALLRDLFPRTKFRLHANARVDGWSSLANLANLPYYRGYYAELGRISQALGAQAYTIHAGLRRNASMLGLLHHLRECEDLLGCPVGVEGMYPTDDNRYNVSSWEEYGDMLQMGMRYALDLSHLNLLVCKTGVRNDDLVMQMLASPQCIEVHLSSNDGASDQHAMIADEPWWVPLLDYVHPEAVVFSEENRLRPR